MNCFKGCSVKRASLKFSGGDKNGGDKSEGLFEGKSEVTLARKLLLIVDELKLLYFNKNKSANMSSLSKSKSDSVVT